MLTLLLSILASILSIAATLPQILKILRKASVNDLSLECFFMHACAGILWCVYGAIIGAIVLAIEAALVGILNAIVVVYILENRHLTPIRPPRATEIDDTSNAADARTCRL